MNDCKVAHAYIPPSANNGDLCRCLAMPKGKQQVRLAEHPPAQWARRQRRELQREFFGDTVRIEQRIVPPHSGQRGSHPSGEGYSEQDLDNITNFSEGTLGNDTASAMSNQ